MCLAYFDPYKARHVSSFYKYCGIDTVQDEDENGNKIFRVKGTNRKVIQRKYYQNVETGEAVDIDEKLISTGEFDEEGNELFVTRSGVDVTPFFRTTTVHDVVDGEEVTMNAFVYEDMETGEDYVGDVEACEHGRRKGDTEMYPYVDKNGNTKMKRGITYNPELKARLLGVLSGCLLKAGDETYAPIYYDYKNRLNNSDRHKDKKDIHKHVMAQRYMIKQFVRNLWTSWRDLEGLPVDNPYEVEKLGNKPHKYNEYQVETAKKYNSGTNE